MRKRPIVVAIVLSIAAVGLSACGGGSSINGVKVTGSKESPKVTVEKGFSVDKTTVKTTKSGDGSKVVKNDTAKVDMIVMNGRTGKQVFDSFSTKTPQSIPLSDKQVGGINKALVGQKVGSQVLAAMAPADAAKQLSQSSTLGIKKDDTLVFLFQVHSVLPIQASGTKKSLPDSVPQITLNAKGQPTGFKGTSKTASSVSKAAAYVSILGKGAKITKGQTVSAQYVGATLKDLKVFQSSWGTSPFTATIGASQVIACWDQLLPGQTVGSRVVLECPAATAYGTKKSTTGSPTGDLIFTIDILDAS